MAATIPDVEKLGWKPRDPNGTDVTAEILEGCIKADPKVAADAIENVYRNDIEIERLSFELVVATRKLAR